MFIIYLELMCMYKVLLQPTVSQGASATYSKSGCLSAYGHILMVIQNKIRSRGIRQEKLNFIFWYSVKFNNRI